MSKHDKFETETKLELSEQDFYAVLHAGSVRKRTAQLNIYFDCDWHLASLAATCRVRIAPEQAQLTVKIPAGLNGTARLMREIDVPIELHEWRATHAPPWRRGLNVMRDLPQEVRSELESLGLERLECQGWARNTRYLVRFPGLGDIELDYLRLPKGMKIYEAEIEHPDLHVHQQMTRLIHSLAPSARSVEISKFERFRRALTRGVRQA
jgi:uncharacterized protein YjbK